MSTINPTKLERFAVAAQSHGFDPEQLLADLIKQSDRNWVYELDGKASYDQLTSFVKSAFVWRGQDDIVIFTNCNTSQAQQVIAERFHDSFECVSTRHDVAIFIRPDPGLFGAAHGLSPYDRTDAENAELTVQGQQAEEGSDAPRQ